MDHSKTNVACHLFGWWEKGKQKLLIDWLMTPFLLGWYHLTYLTSLDAADRFATTMLIGWCCSWIEVFCYCSILSLTRPNTQHQVTLQGGCPPKKRHGRTYGRTDNASYRDAKSHLKFCLSGIQLYTVMKINRDDGKFMSDSNRGEHDYEEALDIQPCWLLVCFR